MALNIQTSLVYDFSETTDILLQIEAAMLPEQQVSDHYIDVSPVEHFARVEGHGGIGERIWLRLNGRLSVEYTARVEVSRFLPDISGLTAMQPHLLPGSTVDYLMPSRYCPSDLFHSFVDGEFRGLEGGTLVIAMRDWINHAFEYRPGSSTSATTAADSFFQRQGVCRDFAHMLVALARAAWIPARYVSVYAPEVKPQDFHAVAEVFLDGAWHLVDATGMAEPLDIAKIGVGRDAADIPFLSSFGNANYVHKQVLVTRG